MVIEPIKRHEVKEQLIATDELHHKLQELDLCGYAIRGTDAAS